MTALGTQWLVDHVNEKCGTEFSQFTMRAMLRKLGDDGVIEKKERGGRYSFKNEKDPIVKAVVKYVSSGEAEKDRREQLDKLKEKRETAKEPASDVQKKEAKPKKQSSAAKAKAAKAKQAEEEEVDELEDIDA